MIQIPETGLRQLLEAMTGWTIPYCRSMAGKGGVEVGPRKVRGYLLALEHPDGHGKAAFFMRFGFRIEEWERLAEALLEHARENRLV